MPISPKEIADKRIENTITKLCDLIDKKLLETDKTPFVFNFLQGTGPQVQTSIAEIYRQAGWFVTLDNECTDAAQLTLNDKNDLLPESSVKNEGETKPEEDAANGLIRSAMGSTEGRVVLAQAMAQPIKTSLIYQSIMRKVFMVDELPRDAEPKYEYESDDNPIYFSKKSQSVQPYNHDCLDDIYEISAMTDDMSTEIEQRKFYVVDRAQVRLKDSLMNQESRIGFQLLKHAAVFEQTIYTYAETIDRAIRDSMAEIETNDLICTKMLMHPRAFRLLQNTFDSQNFDGAPQRDVLMLNIYGHLYTMDIYLSTLLDEHDIYILPPGNFLGVWAIKNDVAVLPCSKNSDKDHETIGFLASIRFMPVLMKPKMVRKIVVKF